MFRFVLNLVLILILGLIQLSSSVFISGIKPNLVLCFVIVSSIFCRDWFQKIILVLVGAIALKFHPGFSWNDILFIVSALVGVLLVKYLTWKTSISLVVAAALSTVLINIGDLNITLVLQIAVNLVISLFIYTILKISYAKK